MAIKRGDTTHELCVCSICHVLRVCVRESVCVLRMGVCVCVCMCIAYVECECSKCHVLRVCVCVCVCVYCVWGRVCVCVRVSVWLKCACRV